MCSPKTEKRPLLRSILISIALIILNGCTMHFVSHSLTNSTWFSSNPNDSHILRILTAVLQLTVGLITTFSIDFIDRKVWLIVLNHNHSQTLYFTRVSLEKSWNPVNNRLFSSLSHRNCCYFPQLVFWWYNHYTWPICLSINSWLVIPPSMHGYQLYASFL